MRLNLYMDDLSKEYCKQVGKALRELRKEHTGKSLCMFAYENDVPRSTLSRIEIGENEPQLVTLKKIAEGFGWSMSELFTHIEDKMPKDFKIFDDGHY
ncbi:TPA: hypothetical protein CPT82_01825 [Candidatus Gastranaerophilales bacterium HUM_2]|nr:MAG TPA: hypothetical protein CPT82_01825 [Candidatus Gastranaerophilales bacterium HUM_2]